MKTIGTLAYGISLDTREFVKGANLAKGEWNRINAVFKQTQTEAERVSAKLAMIEEAFQSGKITEEAYIKTRQRLIESTNEYKQAQQAAAEEEKRRLKMVEDARREAERRAADVEAQKKRLMAEGQAIRQSQMTAEQRYQMELAKTKQRLLELVKVQAISRQEAAEELRKMKAKDPALAAAENARVQAAQMARMQAQSVAGQQEAARQARMAQMSAGLMQLPGVGGLASRGANAMSAGPLGMIALGLAGVTAGFYGAARASKGFFDMMSTQRKVLDDMNDAAQTLGMTVGELQGLQWAALVGGGVDAEKAASSISKLITEIGQAASDPGKESVFSRMGLDIEKLAGAKPRDAVLMVADALRQIEDPFRRNAVADELFGKGGQQMAKALSIGSAEIRKMIAESRQLGISLSEVDIARIAAANDQLDKSQAIMTGIKNTITVEFAPAVLSFSKELTATLKGLEASGTSIREIYREVAGTMLFATGIAKDFTTQSKNVLFDIPKNLLTFNLKGVAEDFNDLRKAAQDPAFMRLPREAERERQKAVFEAIVNRGQKAKDEQRLIDQQKEQEIRDANRDIEQQILQMQMQRNPMLERELMLRKGIRKELVDELEALKASEFMDSMFFHPFDKGVGNFADRMNGDRAAQRAQYEAYDAARQGAEALVESLRKPQDIAEEQIRLYSEWARQGLITKEQFDRASMDATQRMMESRGSSISSATYQSAESYRLFAQLQNDSMKKRSIQEQTDKMQLEAMQNTENHARNMLLQLESANQKLEKLEAFESHA